jgi:hypothetical protein
MVVIMRRLLYFLALLLLCLLSNCSSSTIIEKPVVACQFDELRRFTYVLITSRDDEITTWVKRVPFSSTPDRQDTETRVSSTYSVRIGYCPDENDKFFDMRR